jgi:hypothetical protein
MLGVPERIELRDIGQMGLGNGGVREFLIMPKLMIDFEKGCKYQPVTGAYSLSQCVL